jgi:hypothetical protein
MAFHDLRTYLRHLESPRREPPTVAARDSTQQHGRNEARVAYPQHDVEHAHRMHTTTSCLAGGSNCQWLIDGLLWRPDRREQ